MALRAYFPFSKHLKYLKRGDVFLHGVKGHVEEGRTVVDELYARVSFWGEHGHVSVTVDLVKEEVVAISSSLTFGQPVIVEKRR